MRGRTSGLVLVAGVVLLGGCSNSSPVAVVGNESDSSVIVRLNTDVGESYAVGTIAPGATARLNITGRDKLLWAVATYPDGRAVESQRLYTTTQGTVSVKVTKDAVELTYVL